MAIEQSPGTEIRRVGRVGTTVRAPKTAELIANHLRRRIVRGELATGDRLPPEAQLMEQYGASRPTMREAFRILESESLITVRRGSQGGAQVTAPQVSVAVRHMSLILQLQATSIADVYVARTITESSCARMLAARSDPDTIGQLERQLREISDMAAGIDPDTFDAEAWSHLTTQFHEMVLEGSGNKTLAVQGAVLSSVAAIHLRSRFSSNDELLMQRVQATVTSYAELIDLVKAGDAAGAERHWKAHMAASASYLLADDSGTKQVVDLFE